jgi:hypothetical protein
MGYYYMYVPFLVFPHLRIGWQKATTLEVHHFAQSGVVFPLQLTERTALITA